MSAAQKSKWRWEKPDHAFDEHPEEGKNKTKPDFRSRPPVSPNAIPSDRFDNQVDRLFSHHLMKIGLGRCYDASQSAQTWNAHAPQGQRPPARTQMTDNIAEGLTIAMGASSVAAAVAGESMNGTSWNRRATLPLLVDPAIPPPSRDLRYEKRPPSPPESYVRGVSRSRRCRSGTPERRHWPGTVPDRYWVTTGTSVAPAGFRFCGLSRRRLRKTGGPAL